MRPILVVAGMHRSGTSAITGTLAALGADLPRTVLPANHANRRGHWEPQRLVELHDELLSHLNSSWCDYRKLQGVDTDAVYRTWGPRMKEAFLQEYGDVSLPLLKDPRVCRLLPLWNRVFSELGLAPRYIVPLRHPREVAASLGVRDRIGPTEALLLWARYLLDAERHTRAYPRVVVGFDALMSDWLGVVGRIAAALHLEWPVPPRDAAVDEFLSESERHHQVTSLEEQQLPTPIDVVYDTLRLLEVGPVELSRLDGIESSFAAFCETVYVAAEERSLWLAARLEANEKLLAAERTNAREQIELRNAWIKDVEERLAQEKANAVAQIEYRDALVAELSVMLEAERSNAAAQILYRDELIKQLTERDPGQEVSEAGEHTDEDGAPNAGDPAGGSSTSRKAHARLTGA